MGLIEKDHADLSIRKQCELLQLNRSNVYYVRQPDISLEDIRLMEVIDRIYTKRPFFGVRKMTKQLKEEGEMVNHKRVYRLMQVMGIQAIVPTPHTSQPRKGHAVYPYLLKDVVIERPNQIWGTDITYIKVQGSWLYLVAILDWYSRYVIAWELSDTLCSEFCVDTLTRALRTALPEIHNSDQGSQFTSEEYLNVLRLYPEIGISMDHRGRCFDNIFTERLWRTVKYEEVYLKDYQSPREARVSLTEYFNFYNTERFHQSLGDLTPRQVYFAN